jgi:hypothetical protein
LILSRRLSQEAPVLSPPDFSQPFVVRTDASDFAVGAVIGQGTGKQECVVAYTSRKLNPAELNYPTHEKELLAVVNALREWRHYLQGQPFTVITDNWAVKHAQTSPQLSRRQARWLETLQEYDFKIEHKPGHTNDVPDALSRRPDYRTPSDQQILGALTAALDLEPSSMQATRETIRTVRRTAELDDEYKTIRTAVQEDKRQDFVIVDNLLYFTPTSGAKRLYIPSSSLRNKLLAEAHDIPIAGHLGRQKTLERLQRHFYWPNMAGTISAYVRTCPACQVNKPSNQKPIGLLQPLPIPNRPWESVSLDQILGLPLTAGSAAAAAPTVSAHARLVEAATARALQRCAAAAARARAQEDEGGASQAVQRAQTALKSRVQLAGEEAGQGSCSA